MTTIKKYYDNQLYMSAESLRELIVAYRNKGLLRKQLITNQK